MPDTASESTPVGAEAEEAERFLRLVRDEHQSVRQIAQAFGRSPAYVSKRIRLFGDPALRGAIQAGQLRVTELEELLVLPEEHRPPVLERAIASGWGQHELRADVRRVRDELFPPGAESDVPRRGRPRKDAIPRRPGQPRTGAALGRRKARVSKRATPKPGRGRGPKPRAEVPEAPRRASDPGLFIERPSDLTRRIQDLYGVLRELQPFQLNAADDTALGRLFLRMRELAQAPRERQAPVIPSLLDAERAARGGRRR